MAPPTAYDLLRTFDEQNKFNGDNYGSWTQEFEMTFGENLEFMQHVKGPSTPPTEATLLQAWLQADQRARAILYKTISSNAVRTAHFKDTSPSQTANAVWLSLKSEYKKDSRATRFELKKRLYNPVHDASKPVSIYIQDIISAADELISLGHAPATTDVVDSILMNLDSSFAIVRTLLTSGPSEPTLAIVKKTLTDQEDTKTALNGGSQVEELEGALHTKKVPRKGKKKTRRKRDDSDSDSESEDETAFDWLNPKNKDACHRCGRPGHRSSRCIADMPPKIKDKIIEDARRRKHSRQSSDSGNARAGAAHVTTSDSDSASEWDTDSANAYFEKIYSTGKPKEIKRAARKYLRRWGV